mgnify:FL=1
MIHLWYSYLAIVAYVMKKIRFLLFIFIYRTQVNTQTQTQLQTDCNNARYYTNHAAKTKCFELLRATPDWLQLPSLHVVPH